MKENDALFESILALIGLSVVNRLMFRDGILISVGCAAAMIAAFWFGRFGVRLIKNRLRAKKSHI